MWHMSPLVITDVSSLVTCLSWLQLRQQRLLMDREKHRRLQQTGNEAECNEPEPKVIKRVTGDVPLS